LTVRKPQGLSEARCPGLNKELIDHYFVLTLSRHIAALKLKIGWKSLVAFTNVKSKTQSGKSTSAKKRLLAALDDNDDDSDSSYEPPAKKSTFAPLQRRHTSDFCNFCLLQYTDPRCAQLGDWIQCQGKGR